MTYFRTKPLQVGASASYLVRSIKLVWQATPVWTAGWLLLLIVQGVLPAASVYLTRALVNSIVLAIESNGNAEAVRASLVLAGLMGIVLASIELLRGISTLVRTTLSEQVRDFVADLIHAQSIAVDLAFYDLPEYYDHMYRASREAAYRPVALLESLGSLLQNGITLGAMMLVLLPYGWWLPLVLFLSTLPALLVVLRNSRKRHAWERQVTQDERRAWYNNWLLTSREAALDLRLFGLGTHFRNSFAELRRQLREQRLSIVRSEAVSEVAASMVALLAVGGTMLIVIWQVLQGVLDLGDLALVYQAFTQGQGLLRTLLQSVGQIYGNSLFLGDLFQFMSLEPIVRDPEVPVDLTDSDNRDQPIALRFRNVAFAYPGSARSAMENFNIAIPAHKTVAIVGSNGAGKSTFVKLLCRFYDPGQGHVELFGQDLRHMRLEDLRSQLSVLFQTPMQFNMSARDNIGLGYGSREVPQSEIEQAAYFAGADEVIARLPKQYETLLGVWFEEGTDLSQGEWRRMALARTLLRQAPIVVLDEPTSAMDPWAEAAWIRRFRTYAEGKTAIIITHRFTTARHADIIYVMENGLVVESGSHAELLALGGRYAESWAERR